MKSTGTGVIPRLPQQQVHPAAVVPGVEEHTVQAVAHAALAADAGRVRARDDPVRIGLGQRIEVQNASGERIRRRVRSAPVPSPETSVGRPREWTDSRGLISVRSFPCPLANLRSAV